MDGVKIKLHIFRMTAHISYDIIPPFHLRENQSGLLLPGTV